MSISFNHPQNTATSTDSMTIAVSGGSPTAPRPIRLQASSVIMPNRPLPNGEAGAVVFDTTSKSLKYHNGTSWVDLLSQDVMLAPIYTQLNLIDQKLGRKIETVSYSTSSVASASVSGTNLNIVFPLAGSGGGSNVPGLFTSLPPGSITYYSLVSGQTVASIRENMADVSGGQTGRNGTQAAPYRTKSGMCFADGLWWEWAGEGGTVIKQVPNLNQGVYLKTITTSGVTNLGIVGSSGNIGYSTVQIPQHYHGTGGMRGMSGGSADDGYFIYGKTWNDGNSYRGLGIFGDKNYRNDEPIDGNDSRTAFVTTYALYDSADTSSHTHSLNNVDVAHQDVAVLYNIATPSVALNQTAGDGRYVLKTGDVMTGSLVVANALSVKADDSTLPLWFNNAAGAERAVIYHTSSNNTLRLRANGNSSQELALSSTGQLTLGTKNIVRSVNGINADTAGNVNIGTASASLAENGWWKDENTGMITQWGRGDQPSRESGEGYWVDFPIPFPNACFNVQVTHGQTTNTTWRVDIGTWAATPTPTGCFMRAEKQFFWTAIGW